MKELNLQSYCLRKHGGVPIAIGIKVETLSAEATMQAGKQGGGNEFTVLIPIST
jgi:hypothetical protein